MICVSQDLSSDFVSMVSQFNTFAHMGNLHSSIQPLRECNITNDVNQMKLDGSNKLTNLNSILSLLPPTFHVLVSA